LIKLRRTKDCAILGHPVHCVFNKHDIELLAITLSAVDRVWKLFHCWTQQCIICKTNITFCRLLKTSLNHRVKRKSFKMFQLLYYFSELRRTFMMTLW